MLTEMLMHDSAAEFASDVRLGMTAVGQKRLPSKYLYDELGSALFEVITLLPEYGLFRADERVIRQRANDIAGNFVQGNVAIAELGSGSGKKTLPLLEAFASRQPVRYYPIEISDKALDECAKQTAHIQNTSVHPVPQPYLQGLLSVAAARKSGERLIVLFLGSTIGNFDIPEAKRFLCDIRHLLHDGDALLLGTDLEKSAADLVAAYDDSLGVTAAFDLNLLARMNRELGAEFDLAAFRHTARYDAFAKRVEMHLVSIREQIVDIPGADCRAAFAEGETIWTETSQKYLPKQVVEMGRSSRFQAAGQWIDPEWAFAETLFLAH